MWVSEQGGGIKGWRKMGGLFFPLCLHKGERDGARHLKRSQVKENREAGLSIVSHPDSNFMSPSIHQYTLLCSLQQFMLYYITCYAVVLVSNYGGESFSKGRRNESQKEPQATPQLLSSAMGIWNKDYLLTKPSWRSMAGLRGSPFCQGS